MAKRKDILDFRIYVGGRPLEELTAEERAAFGDRAAERMGRALNDYFSRHIDEYAAIRQRKEKTEC